MLRIGLGCLSFFLFILAAATHLHAAAPEEALRRHLADIQKTTAGSIQERELQKTAIELVRKMSAPPAVPQAVQRHMVRGQTFLEEAKSQGSFERAAREFREITRLAPWLAEAHFNLGVVLEKAGEFDAATESLKMALLADPGAKDVQTLIYRIEARKEEAKAQAAERQRQEQARLEAERKQRAEVERRELAKQDLTGEWSEGIYRSGRLNVFWRIEKSRDEFVGTSYYREDASIRMTAILRLRVQNFRITGTWEYDWRNVFRNGQKEVVPVEGEVRQDGKFFVVRYRSLLPAGATGDIANGWVHQNVTKEFYRQ